MKSYFGLTILTRYSYLPNKLAGWKIGQKNNRAGLNNRVGWKNAEKFNNCAG